MDYSAPIIIIGAGRSGTTLLSGMFYHHPEICFAGETGFLVPVLWKHIFEQYNFILPWRIMGLTQSQVLKSLSLHQYATDNKVSPAELDRLRQNEQDRICRVIARTLVELLGIDPATRFWGYKEIWNGNHYFFHDWAIYDLIFPRATWVHLIRNPIEQVASHASKSGTEFTRGLLLERLLDWVSMINYARLRQQTGRYFEFRYEDLLQDPQKTLLPLFQFLNLEWSELCRRALAKRWVPSTRDRAQESKVLRGQLAVPNLYELVEELGYMEAMHRHGVNLRNPETLFSCRKVVINLPKLTKESGNCFTCPLGRDARLLFLCLYEDERELGPLSNNPKAVIERGLGTYAFRETRDGISLLLSTSDNSDPRYNGRGYTLRSASYRDKKQKLASPPSSPENPKDHAVARTHF